ncbi:hypothetical protein KSP24_25000 [Paenibacillus sp. AK121]|uniref:hypothetical protein n=1 Tax=Bacteria TaxID=2 RepID=UPI001C226A9B|nr:MULTISPECIES: hypothetical protein [Bacteria]MBU9710134.1 hypothetical protein [Paenibacillus sp. AK121]MCW1920853.1 hypothetical protein [Rhodobacter sp. KR11]
MNIQNQLKITPHRVAALAETFDDQDIAEIFGIAESSVKALLIEARFARRHWVVRCNRTGRRIAARSQRGAYRMVCLLGFVDWDWWPESEPEVAA